MFYFQSLPEKTRTNLLRVVSAVEDVLPEKTRAWEFFTGTEKPDGLSLIGEISRWSGSGPFLYVIHRLTSAPSDEVVFRAFKNAKDAKEGKCNYARLNAPSPCLYVGGSQKVDQRMKEHLGYASKVTYSLQLNAWARDLNLHLEVCCAQYPAHTSPEVLQALEDTLWHELKPMFGRRGPR